MQRVFIVLDRFEIEKGVVLTGRPDLDGVVLGKGTILTIKRQGLPDLEAKVLDFELMRNCWSPHLPRPVGVLLPKKLGKEDIPSGSEVWCEVA
jgi:hypothetical protein